MAFHRYSKLIAAIQCLLAIVSVAKADETVTHLKTRAGTFDVREAIGPECEEGATFAERCTILTVDDRKVLSDAEVFIERVFPSKFNPTLLHVYTSTGGNACCSEDYIVDSTQTPPLMLKGLRFGPEISRSGNEVTFQMIGGDDVLGDWLKDTYTYKLGSGHAVKVRSGPDYDTAPLTDRTTPPDLLRNPFLRAPILAVVGRGHFKDYRNAIVVSDPIKMVGNYVIGSGCQAHECDHHFGLFVLDALDKLAWAAEAFEELDPNKSNAKVWGVLTPNDPVPLREVRLFLAKHHIPESSVTFAPLSAKVVKAYREPRKAVATIAPSPAPQTIAVLAAPPIPELATVPPSSGSQVRVPLESRGGTFVVPVTINGRLTLDFTLDSGASDVSIPADVVMTLIRTGTIGDADFLGKQTYQLADGSTVPSQTFRIRSLKVGDSTLENIVGSVAPVAGGLLLGQSFLSRFSSWSIDNKAKALVLN